MKIWPDKWRNKLKRITIIAHGLSNGGAERVASILANGLNRDGYNVLFIAAYSNDHTYKLDDEIHYEYINAKGSKLAKFFNRARIIKELAEKFNSDVVISFIHEEIIFISLFCKIPVICSLRNNPASVINNGFHKIAYNIIYTRAKNIVFQTPGARNYFKKKIRSKGVIIGNPITSNLPYWNIKNHKKIIMTACRLTEQKNIPMLINSFSRFCENHPEYILKIYGEGPLKRSLQELTKKLNISDKVEFPGYTNNIYEIMSNAAMFVLTSNYEGLSNSMLEAMAIGIPVICTDCPPGGASLYIKDGVNGFLVPVNNTESLTNKLNILANNAKLCETISTAEIDIRHILSVDRIIKEWEQLL